MKLEIGNRKSQIGTASRLPISDFRHPPSVRNRAVAAACALALTLAAGAAVAQDLCGRPREAPDALYRRLIKTEKIPESFRDKAYAIINDAAKGTLWTFTLPGHPAHPSVVCRQPVEDGDKRRIAMDILCEAPDAECERLARAFEDLNRRMLEDAERQGK